MAIVVVFLDTMGTDVKILVLPGHMDFGVSEPAIALRDHCVTTRPASVTASPGSLDPVVICPVPGDSTGGTVRKVVVVRNTEAVTR